MVKLRRFKKKNVSNELSAPKESRSIENKKKNLPLNLTISRRVICLEIEPWEVKISGIYTARTMLILE